MFYLVIIHRRKWTHLKFRFEKPVKSKSSCVNWSVITLTLSGKTSYVEKCHFIWRATTFCMTPFNFEKPGKYQNVCNPIDNLYAFTPEKQAYLTVSSLTVHHLSMQSSDMTWNTGFFWLIRQFKCNSCGHVNEKPDTITFLNQPRTYLVFQGTAMLVFTFWHILFIPDDSISSQQHVRAIGGKNKLTRVTSFS